MKFEWFGERLIRGEEVTTNGYEVLHVMVFDLDDGVYEWHRYWEVISEGRTTRVK
jgi:hypothetical protein